jgi:hypothetical protein
MTYCICGVTCAPKHFSATQKTQGALAAAACFSGRKILYPHPTRINVQMFCFVVFLPFALFCIVHMSSAVYHVRSIIMCKVQCSHCLRLFCCGRRDQLKESGHASFAPWTSTAGQRLYYVHFRQEAETAGAVLASDGDLAAHSQIVGSVESTTRSRGP